MFFQATWLIVVVLCSLAYFYKGFLWPKNLNLFNAWFPSIKYGLSLIFAEDVFSFMKAIGDYSITNGGISVFHLGWKSIYVITNPEYATIVHSKCLEKMFVYKYITPLFGDTLIAAGGAVWIHQRRLADLVFKQNILNSYLEIFNNQSECLVDALEKKITGEYVDVTDEITFNVLETACQTTLGLNKDKETFVNEKYVKAIHRVFEITTMRVRKPWLTFDVIFNHLSLKKELDQSLATIHETSNMMVKLRKTKHLKRLQSGEKDGVEIRSFLQILLEHSTTPKGNLTELQLRYLCDNVLLAGFDTSTYELLFTLICIGSDSAVQERIYQEITEVLGQETTVTREHVAKLTYLEAAIKEALRLYPIGPFVGREASSDVRLGNVTIPAGSSVVVHLWGINRNKEHWGRDSEEYNPGRWLNTDSLPKHPNAFASFSFGKRNCIGKHYAMLYMKTTVVHVLRKYRITSDHKKMKFDCYIMLKSKSGHLMKLENR